MSTFNVPLDQLQEWIANYDDNVTYENNPEGYKETRNVVFALQDLEALVAHCKTNAQVNAVRFYLVRQNDYANGTRHIIFDNQTQISLVAVPVLEFENNGEDANGNPTIPTGKCKDWITNNAVTCIYPNQTLPLTEHGGLCPYNCEGSLTNTFGAVS